MIIGRTYLAELNHTLEGNWWEAMYITEILDGTGKVVQLLPEKRNFSPGQKAEFLVKLDSVSGAQVIAANEAKVAAEASLASEVAAHAATKVQLASMAEQLAALQPAPI